MTLLTVGCGGPPKDDGVHPAWPAPPAAPRIVHLQTIRSNQNMGQPDLLQSVGGAIFGKSGLTLQQPSGIAVQEEKQLYVADQQWQGVAEFQFNSTKTRFLSKVGDKHLVSPVGLAWCDGLLAVADSVLNKVYLLDEDDKVVRTLDKPDGGFRRPTGLAFDAQRHLLYVADTIAHEICVFDLQGKLVRRFGGIGEDIGRFNFPTHLCVDRQGRLYVTDSMNFRVQVFDAQGKYLYEIGRHGNASGHMGVPKGIAVDSQDHIYIVDSYFSVVQIFDQQGRFLLSFGQPGSAVGQFEVPTAITIDSQDRIYVSDSQNRRVQVFQYLGEPNNEDSTTTNP